ncbi:MAG TPA: VanZ family protein [Gemmatimonadaceae bacterium]|nr:VanZ family protein [Gemmatimonadaceae bacterium]
MHHGNRRAGTWVTAAAVLVILVATLIPASPGIPISGPWCLLCGHAGTIDAIQNVVLFIPLGFGLAWLGASRAGTVVAAFALSAFVESMQFTIIPGRDASLGDLLFNSIGGLAGLALQRARLTVINPPPRLARGLRGIAGLGWFLVLLAATFGLRPAVPRGHAAEWRVAAAIDSVGVSLFSASVRALSVDGVEVQPIEPGPLHRIRSRLGRRPSTIAVVVQPEQPPPGYVPIISVDAGRTHAFSFGQSGSELYCQRFLVASAFLLRTPSFVLPGAFPLAEQVPAEEATRHELHCAWEGGQVVVRRLASGDTAEVRVPLSPGLGWALFVPANLGVPNLFTRGMRFAWLAAVALPLGFWQGAGGRQGPSRVGPDTRPHRAGMGTILLLVMLLLVQGALPALAGTAPSPPMEYAATATGFFVGWGIAHLMRPRHLLSIRP